MEGLPMVIYRILGASSYLDAIKPLGNRNVLYEINLLFRFLNFYSEKNDM